MDLVRYDPYGYPIFPGERGYHSCGGEVDRFDNQEKPAMSNIELIEALNLLCEHCLTHLSDGWEIVLTMRRADCSLELLDPDGTIIDVETDVGCGLLATMCRESNKLNTGT